MMRQIMSIMHLSALRPIFFSVSFIFRFTFSTASSDHSLVSRSSIRHWYFRLTVRGGGVDALVQAVDHDALLLQLFVQAACKLAERLDAFANLVNDLILETGEGKPRPAVVLEQ
jgi:hypothetical protein